MKRLYVLYDHGCGLCTSAARWLRAQPHIIPLTPIPAASQKAADRFPTLAGPDHTPGEVIVIADTGEVWRGPAAWIMCLYALKRDRRLAFTLSRPGWLPLTSKVIELLSNYRLGLSSLLRLHGEHLASGKPTPAPECPTGACAAATAYPAGSACDEGS